MESAIVKAEESVIKKIAPAFTILSSIIAVTALLFNFTIHKRSFTCTYLGSDSVVQIDKGALVGPLTMRYRDRPVDSLYKLRFVLKNTGSTAIKGTDVMEPLELYFPAGYVLLDSPAVEQRRPDFTINAVADLDDKQKIRVSFPLMNSGDEATISIFALTLASSSPRLVGRIVDVPQIDNIDSGKTKSASRSGPRLNAGLLWTLAVLNGLLSLAFLSLLVWLFVQYFRYKLWAGKWKSEATAVKAVVTREHRERIAAERKVDPKTIDVASGDIQLQENLALAAAGIPQEPKFAVETFKDLLQVEGFLIAFGTFTGLTTYVLCIYSVLD